jgi:hypothetical protein
VGHNGEHENFFTCSISPMDCLPTCRGQALTSNKSPLKVTRVEIRSVTYFMGSVISRRINVERVTASGPGFEI